MEIWKEFSSNVPLCIVGPYWQVEIYFQFHLYLKTINSCLYPSDLFYFFQSDKYTKQLDYLQSLFGEVLTISLKEDQILTSSSTWINKYIAQLFVHSRIIQCSRFFHGELMYNLETNIRCPGGCGLRKYENIITLDSLIGMVYYLALKNASIFAFPCLNFAILSNILSLNEII